MPLNVQASPNTAVQFGKKSKQKGIDASQFINYAKQQSHSSVSQTGNSHQVRVPGTTFSRLFSTGPIEKKVLESYARATHQPYARLLKGITEQSSSKQRLSVHV